ncbi:DUF1735 domain-containing protein [Spirosoma pollinicola]|nr:DUF1735 domain-containing protein [Spirosoma pollinicola]
MNKLCSIIVAASLAVGLISCLKDDEHFVDFAGVGYVAEIPYVANRSILKTVTVGATSTSLVAPVDINIASPTPPTQDVPVTVAIDQTALTAYNTANKTAYTILPAAAYQLSNPMVTVAAGQRIATVNVNFVGTQIPATGGPYAVPISITTVPSNVIISANYHTQILVVSLTK